MDRKQTICSIASPFYLDYDNVIPDLCPPLGAGCESCACRFADYGRDSLVDVSGRVSMGRISKIFEFRSPADLHFYLKAFQRADRSSFPTDFPSATQLTVVSTPHRRLLWFDNHRFITPCFDFARFFRPSQFTLRSRIFRNVLSVIIGPRRASSHRRFFKAQCPSKT